MKIAVTCVNNQVFQHFGHCPSFLICEVENKEIISHSLLETQEHSCAALAKYLSDYGVEVIICGQIGAGAKNHINSFGMKVFPGACGDALTQVKNYLQGTLHYDQEAQCHHHDDHHCHHE